MVLVTKFFSAGPWTTSSSASMFCQPPTPSILFWILPSTNRALSTPASLRWYTTLCLLDCSLRCDAWAADTASRRSPDVMIAATADIPRLRMLRLLLKICLDDFDPRPRIELDPLELAEVLGDHVPGRRPRDFGPDRGPAHGLIAPLRLDRPAVHADLADPPPDGLPWIDRIAEPAHAQHVAALPVVRVAMEEIVGHILHDAVDLGAAELAREDVRIRKRRMAVHVLHGDLLARDDGQAPPEARRERHLSVESLEEGIEDDLVEAAVEVATAIEQALRHRNALAEPGFIGRPNLADELRHLLVRRDVTRQDWEELITVALDPAPAHVEIEAAQELAMGPGVDHQRPARRDGSRKAVMGVAAEDDVDPAHPAGHLEVGGQAVVAQQHHQVDCLVAPELVDQPLALRFLDAEGQAGNEALRMRHGHIRKPLADHGDLDAPRFSDRIRLEDRLVPVQLSAIVADEVALKEAASPAVAEELPHAVHAIREFPMWREDLDAELVHGPDHILAARPEGCGRAVERVAAVEEERLPRPLGARALDHGGEVSVAAHAAVACRQRGEVEVGERVGLGAAALDAVMPEEGLAREVSGLAHLVPDADQGVGLTVVDGQQRQEIAARDVHGSTALTSLAYSGRGATRAGPVAAPALRDGLRHPLAPSAALRAARGLGGPTLPTAQDDPRRHPPERSITVSDETHQWRMPGTLIGLPISNDVRYSSSSAYSTASAGSMFVPSGVMHH